MTANTYKTDLYAIHHVIQNALSIHPKEVLIESLRKFFSEDSYYHYVSDEFGFPKTPDQINLDVDSGINDDATTRIFIGEPYRQDIVFYPALLVRDGSSRFVPISMNNEEGSIKYTTTRYVDGYGNEVLISTPDRFIAAGAWDGSMNIEIEAKSPTARDELVDLVGIFAAALRRRQLDISGVFIKGVDVGSPTESEDRVHGKLFKRTVTLQIRTEWRQEVPIGNIIDAINISLDFGNLEVSPPVLAPNLSIATSIELINSLSGL